MPLTRSLALAVPLLAAAPALACEVDATGLSFGNILLERTNQTVGRITVTCDTATRFEVAIGGGAQRVMNGPGGAALAYMIFGDPSFTVEWGDGTTIGPRQVAQSDGRTPTELSVYGVVPAQPGLPAGGYTASLVVTIVY